MFAHSASRFFVVTVLLASASVLAACGPAPLARYSGPQYPETAEVRVRFQPEQIPPSCRVFAELFAFYPADVSAQTVAEVLTNEARSRGAHFLLVGQSREAAENGGMGFMYFGPPREYALDQGWSNWSAGFSVWKKQLGWVGLGSAQWGREDLLYDHPIVTQAAFLRCNE